MPCMILYLHTDQREANREEWYELNDYLNMLIF